MADPKKFAPIYRSLRLIRRAEEEVARIYPSDKIKSPVHLSIGQEAPATGICEALRDDDVVSITYRGHAAYIAKGGSLKALFAELYGKADGCAAGKGGSMHLIGVENGILGASAVVGTTIPVAAGYALALQQRGEDRIVACYLGDGATEEGVFAETLNFAALKKLPILFVCENNGYAIHSPVQNRWASPVLADRVGAYDIPYKSVEDGDVFGIYDAANDLIPDIRSGQGPAFLEAAVYRWKQHVGPDDDFDAGYRTREDLIAWQERDPVLLAGEKLSEQERGAIDQEIEDEIAAAIEFAENSPWPDEAETFTHVYA